jgi:two-component system chemotaxis response regulator CheB
MSVKKHSNGEVRIVFQDSPPVNRHKPSVDVMMKAAATVWGKKVVGLILTGMGEDGATGLLDLKRAGASTFNQDEATSVVYGMPRAAWERGASDKQVPLNQIPQEILKRLVVKKIA